MKQRRDEAVEKDKFYEGASWLAKQSVTLCEDGMRKFDGIKSEYQ